jgi:hypothetical protein
MRSQDWLEVVRAEYLAAFVAEGGAAVKFVTLDLQAKLSADELLGLFGIQP